MKEITNKITIFTPSEVLVFKVGCDSVTEIELCSKYVVVTQYDRNEKKEFLRTRFYGMTFITKDVEKWR